jgi:hypothetical protein
MFYCYNVTSEPSLFDFLDDQECFDVDSATVHALIPVADDVISQIATEVDDESISTEVSYDRALVEVRRSKRRKKSSAAFREQGKIVIVVPIRMSQRELNETIDELLIRLKKIERRTTDPQALQKRAQYLVKTYLDFDVLAQHPVQVVIRWVTNQNSRWGSCTPGTGSIRLSHRLQTMPQYVQDAVLLHELIHLIEIYHNDAFHELMNRYPELPQARAYLEGYALGRNA